MKHGKKKTKYTWVPWVLGLGGAGVVAYILFRPKTALAADKGQAPPPIIPGPGNIQITKGSNVTLVQNLRARYGGDYVNVPTGTVLVIEQLDADGTIWFKYGGQLLSSPIEDYSDKIGG
jgi:hypothetical protein